MLINEACEDGKVVLIASPQRCYIDVAAKFCRSPKELDDIIASPYNKQLMESIITSNHWAATEFDWWLFGVSGYSRACEAQLIRKRHASYLISSGRHTGKRNYEITLPKSITDLLDENIIDDPIYGQSLLNYLNLTEHVYNWLLSKGVAPEDARYLKPQATSFKAIVGMNTHSLADWFKIRMCKRAQHEIRDMATKMYNICKSVQPDVFEHLGPTCKVLGYCPEQEGCGAAPSLNDMRIVYQKYGRSKPKEPVVNKTPTLVELLRSKKIESVLPESKTEESVNKIKNNIKNAIMNDEKYLDIVSANQDKIEHKPLEVVFLDEPEEKAEKVSKPKKRRKKKEESKESEEPKPKKRTKRGTKSNVE